MSKKIISILIVLLLILSFVFTPIEFNKNGFVTAKELLSSALTPNLSELPKAIEAAFITVAYAGAAISLAILIGFIFSLFASGILTSSRRIQNSFKRLFASARAIHELIWALFFVTIFGLTPMSAILALFIPYSGMLGKVFTDILEQSPKSSIERLEYLGASKLQQVLYGYLPIVRKEFTSYSLYRFECAIRSSTILSFVGISGLGMKIQLTLNDLRFNEMFTYIYVLIFVIILIEVWGNLYRTKSLDKITTYLSLIIVMGSWSLILFYEGALYDRLLTIKNLNYAVDFIQKLLGFQTENIAFLDPNEIITVLGLTLRTIQMSLVGISIALLGMITTVVAATKQYSNPIVYFVTRTLYLITRAIPELIWAMLLVFIFKPGLWAGALALGLHNLGILSKLCAEVIESMEQKPLQLLKQSGASKNQLLIYGVIPSVYKRFISYIIYRWEIILRTTIVVGIVGAGGLGYYFKLHFSFFHYTHITLVIIIYLILVRLADYLSHRLNKLYS